MKECVVLEVILDRSRDRRDPILPMIRQKLAGAKVFFRDEIDARVVTLNSRVVFRVNGGPPKTRVVAQQDERLFPGAILPITSLRGMALLGLQEGQSIAVQQPDGLQETIRVEHVEYQPEAAMRLARKNASRADERCRILSLSEHRQMRSSGPPLSDDDDPGPTAA
jgi:regulator of nucleoside diphosphate kinase